MKKYIKKDLESGIVQITIADERWYIKQDNKGNEIYVPSVTWISGHYPKGTAFYKWLASKGWNEAEAIKQAAADKGSKVHRAIVDLIDKKEVPMDAKYPNTDTGELEELSLEEYECIMSFVEWYKSHEKIEPLAREVVVFNDKEGYAGTVDFICKIDDEPYIIDFKTGQNIWPEYEIQISAYKHALDIKDPILAILQLGYRRNKKMYKFTPIDDKFDLFLHAKAIWENECKGIEPKKKDYPEVLTLKGE